MTSPLLVIRIKHSEHLALHAGQQFDTIAQFESALRRARRRAPTGGRIGFVLTWRNRSTFHGWYDLERDESLVEHVGRVCRDVLTDPRLHCLLPGIRATADRLFEATIAERLGGSNARRPAQEASWRTLGA